MKNKQLTKVEDKILNIIIKEDLELLANEMGSNSEFDNNVYCLLKELDEQKVNLLNLIGTS